MKKYFKLTIMFCTLLLIGACSSSGGDDTPPPPTGGGDDDPVVIPDPTAATLIFPEDNTECNEGEPMSDIESTVTFQWNASQNTDSYLVTTTNLNTGDSFNTVANTNQAPITILRGTPYEWFVTSRANGTNVTAQSNPFRFYNEGPGIENYAPFPAKAVSPTRGTTFPINTTSVTLEWTASDVDNDIIAYEVLLGLDESENLISLGTTAENTYNVDVSAGNVYVWLIQTRDSQGNTSNSEEFLFRVDE